MRARYWFVALVAGIVLLSATEAAAHSRHRRQVAAFMGPVSVARAAGVRIVHAKRAGGLRAKAATLEYEGQLGAGFNCGVYVGPATGNDPKEVSTTDSEDDLDQDTDTGDYYEVTECSGTVPATKPDSEMTLQYGNCSTYLEASPFTTPGTGSVTVEPSGSYTASCAAPYSP